MFVFLHLCVYVCMYIFIYLYSCSFSITLSKYQVPFPFLFPSFFAHTKECTACKEGPPAAPGPPSRPGRTRRGGRSDEGTPLTDTGGEERSEGRVPEGALGGAGAPWGLGRRHAHRGGPGDGAPSSRGQGSPAGGRHGDGDSQRRLSRPSHNPGVGRATVLGDGGPRAERGRWRTPGPSGRGRRTPGPRGGGRKDATAEQGRPGRLRKPGRGQL